MILVIKGRSQGANQAKALRASHFHLARHSSSIRLR